MARYSKRLRIELQLHFARIATVCNAFAMASDRTQAAATCSELCLPFRATQRRCNFARAAIAHGVHVARASSKSCVILQLTGQLHNRLLYACGGHAIVTRADATCSCTARSNPPRLQEPQRGCARGVKRVVCKSLVVPTPSIASQ